MTPLTSMRIAHFSLSDGGGGAARAAYRIHKALRSTGHDSTMRVNSLQGDDWTVRGPETKGQKLMTRFRAELARLPRHVLRTADPILQSPAVVRSGWAKVVNGSDIDIVHLHWIHGEMMSIADIGRIRKPVVWTLHDMWPFCGAEHYTEDERWRTGYHRRNRPAHEKGFDLNRWTWARKRRHWQRPIHIVAPSHWMAECARNSALMRNWPVTVVPYAIDTDRWKPMEPALARKLLDLPPDVPLLLFGAMGGGRDPRKGFDLLQHAMWHLRDEPRAKGLELVVFGQLAPEEPPDLGFPIHYAGHLHDDLSLRVLYSAASVFVLPSRQDNLPLTGMESLACGTPVVAFDTGGLPDIVIDGRTGYLVRAFDTEDLAAGVVRLLSDANAVTLGANARAHAVENYSYPVAAKQYLSVYEQAKEAQGAA